MQRFLDSVACSHCSSKEPAADQEVLNNCALHAVSVLLHLQEETEASLFNNTKDLLAIALNARPSATAESAAIAVATIALATVLPPDMVDAAIVQQLLLTAFARRYHRVLQLAMEFEVVQHLQRASLADVLLLVQEAVAFYPPWRHTAGVHIADYQPFRHITYQLVRLPAAADTSLDDLAPLLRTASARECEFVIEALCSLPAAVDLPREECTLLLRQAVQHDLPRAVACLCKLKAAKCLSPTDWYDIVMTALTGSHAVGIKYLMQLEAAEGVSADAVAELLETAYHNEQLHVVEALQQLPAVVQISGGQMFAIVKVVVEQVSTLSLGRHVYHCSLLETLDKWTRYNTGMLMNITGAQLLELLSILLEHNCQCEPIASFVWSERMPVSLVPEGLMMQQNMRIIEQGNLVLLQAVCRHEATPVGPESVLQLWTAAAEMEDMISKSCSAEMQAELCKLRGAAQLNSSQLYGHMMSIVNNNRTVVPDWCRLSAQFTGSEVTDLLKTATRYQHTDNMRTLCGLKAAAALRCSQVYPLLAEVVNSNQTLVLQLCSLPAAAQLAAGQVLDLLMTAVKHGNSENVRSLCSLSASNKLNCNQLLAVIQTVVDSNQPLVPALWELPAAVQLTSTNVADLITAAMTQQNVNTVYMLCRSEAASKLSSNEMIGLISTAANCASPAMAEAVCSISTSEPVDVCKLEMILRKRRKCVQK